MSKRRWTCGRVDGIGVTKSPAIWLLLSGLSTYALPAWAQEASEFDAVFDGPAAAGRPSDPPPPLPPVQPTRVPQDDSSAGTRAASVPSKGGRAPDPSAPPADVNGQLVGAAAAFDGAAAQAPGPSQEADLVHNTWRGSVGGIHVKDAAAGQAGTMRVQLGLRFFAGKSVLEEGDRYALAGGALSLSYTLTDYLELFGAVEGHSARHSESSPELLQVLGDIHVGAKGHYRVLPWLAFGGDLSLHFLNAVGDLGILARSTGVSLGTNITADLRRLEGRHVPFIARFGAHYRFDNSARLVQDVEARRFAGLDGETLPGFETRHLVTPRERLTLGIQRVDTMNLGVGFEAPFEVTRPDFVLAPIFEWQWAIPVNRQGYNCPFVADAPGSDRPRGGGDGCLAVQGLKAATMDLTVGLRVTPPVRGLSTFLAADIGVTGTRTFVRELSPNLPFVVMLGVAYAYDTRAPVVAPSERMPAPERAPLPSAARMLVQINDADGEVVSAARLDFDGQDADGSRAFYTLASDSAGRVVTPLLRPGRYAATLTHPDYTPGSCAFAVPDASQLEVDEAASARTDDADSAESTAASRLLRTTSLPFPNASLLSVTCRVGPRVESRSEPERARGGALLTVDVAGEGKPLARVRIELEAEGPEAPVSTNMELLTDSRGRAKGEAIAPGTYRLTLSKEGYFDRSMVLALVDDSTQTVVATLVRRPARAQVKVDARGIVTQRRFSFATGSSELGAANYPLLFELAEVLRAHPELGRVEIQGHTDNVGKADLNLKLSQARAEAVRTWLIEEGGVDARRLVARGYGDARPLVPNLTPANRRRNRRVHFAPMGE